MATADANEDFTIQCRCLVKQTRLKGACKRNATSDFLTQR